MALKFYQTPFHVTCTPDIADKNVLKVDLTIIIRDIIEQQNWDELEAAQNLAVTQSCVSDLINGRIENLTLDMLFSILDKLGFKAKFTSGQKIDQALIKKIQRIQQTA